MVFFQAIAAVHALLDVIGLPGNLLVIVTIVLESRFHVMRYILLASLAVSDFLFLILVNSLRIASIAQERWPFGETMCLLNAFFARYFYVNTVLHLVAVSYERYSAIVKLPLTYTGRITKSRAVLIVLIWIIPIPVSIGPLFGLTGRYDYNAKVFCCKHARMDGAKWFKPKWFWSRLVSLMPAQYITQSSIPSAKENFEPN